MIVPERTDPFGRGLTAFRSGGGRSACPFDPTHFEGRRWLAGWDHGSQADARSAPPAAPGRSTASEVSAYAEMERRERRLGMTCPDPDQRARHFAAAAELQNRMAALKHARRLSSVTGTKGSSPPI